MSLVPDHVAVAAPGLKREGDHARESRLVGFARLGNLDVFDYYLSVLVVAAAFGLPGITWQAAALPTLVAFLAGEVCVIVAMVAFDDITGFRDGSDTANYAPDAAARRMRRKPLVAGTLTEREALVFGWSAALLGAALWASAVAMAPYRPGWALAVIAVTFVVTLQYSYGLKFSYHGAQELIIAGLGWALVIGPYGLVTGTLPGFVLVLALLFGLGPLLFGVYSNTNDVPGDRAVGRITVATITTPRGNAYFVAAVSAVEFGIGAVASAIGVAPWWFVLLMLPVTALRLRQYHLAFRACEVLRARRLGIRTHRIATALLVVAALLAGVGGLR